MKSGLAPFLKILQSFGLSPAQVDQAIQALPGEASRNLDKYFNLDSAFRLSDGTVSLVPFGLTEVYSAEYLQWMAEPEVVRTIGRFDYLLPVTRQKLLDYVAGLDRTNTIFLAMYLEGAERRFVGTLKIYGIDPKTGLASIGIMVGSKKDWGKGLASRAIALACDYAFGVLSLRKITAAYYETNLGMERAFAKCGFEREAVLKKQILDDGKLIDHVHVARFKK